MTKGRVSLARGAMEAAASGHEPALLDAAHEQAVDLAALVRAGQLTAAEVHAAFAERIRLVNPQVNAYLTVLPGDPGGAARRTAR